MQDAGQTKSDDVVEVINPNGASAIVLVCEHASAFIPDTFKGLGLSAEARHSHIAWDPGALAVARAMSEHLDAPLVASKVSRLVYDCNRPPEAAGAMPTKSEIYAVPGNEVLSDAERAARVQTYYAPFHAAVTRTMAAHPAPFLVTVHSFTPIYHGAPRAVEIGVLHDSDTRLADAMLASAATFGPQMIRRNDPYGAQDGVTHTLQRHAIAQGHPNVMIEVRNDLIATPESQRRMGTQLAQWLLSATAQVSEAIACRA